MYYNYNLLFISPSSCETVCIPIHLIENSSSFVSYFCFNVDDISCYELFNLKVIDFSVISPQIEDPDSGRVSSCDIIRFSYSFDSGMVYFSASFDSECWRFLFNVSSI